MHSRYFTNPTLPKRLVAPLVYSAIKAIPYGKKDPSQC